MEQQTLRNITTDLKTKRDALSLCHEELKKDSDDWNKTIIVLSLLNGMIETVKIQLNLNSSGFKLMPIFISSVIAIISSLIKFRDYPRRMEILIQSISMLTESLNKYRNHTLIDKELIRDYNNALEKLETSIYPDIRRKYLYLSHKNLISIMKQEKKYFASIELVSSAPDITTSDMSCESNSKPRPSSSFIFNRNQYDADVEETV
tara:strand:- start:277 stop:891 length:615 start_codon:yes stop_codon:yes gene_type:complete